MSPVWSWLALNSQFSCLSQSSTGIKLCATMVSSLKNLLKKYFILNYVYYACVCVCLCVHLWTWQCPTGVKRGCQSSWSWMECLTWVLGTKLKSPKAEHTLNSWATAPALSFTSLKQGWVWLSSNTQCMQEALGSISSMTGKKVTSKQAASKDNKTGFINDRSELKTLTELRNWQRVSS